MAGLHHVKSSRRCDICMALRSCATPFPCSWKDGHTTRLVLLSVRDICSHVHTPAASFVPWHVCDWPGDWSRSGRSQVTSGFGADSSSYLTLTWCKVTRAEVRCWRRPSLSSSSHAVVTKHAAEQNPAQTCPCTDATCRNIPPAPPACLSASSMAWHAPHSLSPLVFTTKTWCVYTVLCPCNSLQRSRRLFQPDTEHHQDLLGSVSMRSSHGWLHGEEGSWRPGWPAAIGEASLYVGRLDGGAS